MNDVILTKTSYILTFTKLIFCFIFCFVYQICQSIRVASQTFTGLRSKKYDNKKELYILKSRFLISNIIFNCIINSFFSYHFLLYFYLSKLLIIFKFCISSNLFQMHLGIFYIYFLFLNSLFIKY